MKIKIVTCVGILCTLAFSSCATIFTGTKQHVQFQSEPPGAKVEINGLEVGSTPCTVPVSKSLGSKLVTYKLEGYKDKQLMMERSFNAVSIVNILIPLGFVVDIATGAITKFDQGIYKVTLEENKTTSTK